MKIKLEVSTELGGKIISDLKKSGWKISEEYDKSYFDKGIDHDFYHLLKDCNELYFEWSNWLEWTVKGQSQLIEDLIKAYKINVKYFDKTNSYVEQHSNT